MSYEVDRDYGFRETADGIPYLPDDVTMDGELYVLPNGKYLPTGVYRLKDGRDLIYEPAELNPFADMLKSFH